MDGYHLALFIHLLALVASSAAAALTHLAFTRSMGAETVGERLQWHAFGGAASRVFPVSVLTLLVTGGYMIAFAGAWSWREGWVRTGIAGAVLLFVLGGVMGARQARAGGELARLQKEHGPGHGALPGADPVVAALAWINPGIALAEVFVMTAKPALPQSVAALAVGIVAGAVLSRVLHRGEAAAEVSLG